MAKKQNEEMLRKADQKGSEKWLAGHLDSVPEFQ